jgi:hypothetical protein
MSYVFVFLWAAFLVYCWLTWIGWLRSGVIFDYGAHIHRERQPFFYWIGMCSTGLATTGLTGFVVLMIAVKFFQLEL